MSPEQAVTDEAPVTDTTTRPDNPAAPDAEEPAPNGNTLVLLAPDGTITVTRMPPADTPSDEFIAHRQAFRNVPAGATPTGILAMSRGNNMGSLQIHAYAGASPGRDQLAKLRPLVISRWSARVHAYGETRYEEDFGIFGLGHEPAIVRTSAEIGPELAASCTGKPIFHARRDDGLRYGGSHEPGIGNLAGFIESAECDEHGIVATLLILAPFLDWDLKDLEATGELESARLCLHLSAHAWIARRTAWGVKVFDLAHATAKCLDFTSLAHSPATHVLRRLAPDEPLCPDDFRPSEWLHVPRNLVVVPTESAGVVIINPGAVTNKITAPGSSTITETSNLSQDIPDMSLSITTTGAMVVVTLKMRELRIANLHSVAQAVTVFAEITDASNNVVEDDHWTFPLQAAGGLGDFIVVPVSLTAWDTPAAGSHTYKGRWRVAGTVSSNVQILNSNKRQLTAIELKR